jgi:hypothetical protein
MHVAETGGVVENPNFILLTDASESIIERFLL